MKKCVAFLRAINVGGHTVKMDRLRELFESLGLESVETFIASGNVIFEPRPKDVPATLEKRIEARLHESLGFEVATFIRMPEEIAAIVRFEPFPPAAMKASKALNIAFLKEPLGKSEQEALDSLSTNIDRFSCRDREVYWLCRNMQSESTFSNARFEKKLAVRATFRGWSSVTKLAGKFFSP